MDNERKITQIIIVVVSIILIGISGYVLIEGWNFFDAFYMVIITLTTIGFQEVHPLSNTGRAFTILLALSGVSILSYSIYTIMTMTLEGELIAILGIRKMEKKLSEIKDHYIICGYGRIGRLVAHEFAKAEIPFVIVEAREELIEEKLKNQNIPYIKGDASEDDVLISAGIKRAKGLVAVVADDADNVFITLTARELNKDLFIVARAGQEGAEQKLRRAGADKVVSPYFIGGITMVHAILRPNVSNFIELATHSYFTDLQIEEVKVETDCYLIGKNLIQTDLRRSYNVIVLAVNKASGVPIFNPAPETVIEEGDVLILLGHPKMLFALQQEGKSKTCK